MHWEPQREYIKYVQTIFKRLLKNGENNWQDLEQGIKEIKFHLLHINVVNSLSYKCLACCTCSRDLIFQRGFSPHHEEKQRTWWNCHLELQTVRKPGEFIVLLSLATVQMKLLLQGANLPRILIKNEWLRVFPNSQGTSFLFTKPVSIAPSAFLQAFYKNRSGGGKKGLRWLFARIFFPSPLFPP